MKKFKSLEEVKKEEEVFNKLDQEMDNLAFYGQKEVPDQFFKLIIKRSSLTQLDGHIDRGAVKVFHIGKDVYCLEKNEELSYIWPHNWGYDGRKDGWAFDIRNHMTLIDIINKLHENSLATELNVIIEIDETK